MKMSKSLETSFVIDRFEDKYILDVEVYKGGTGIIWKAHKEKDPETKVAIKFYIPTEPNLFFQISSMDKLLKPLDLSTYEAEFNFLKKVKHPGLQELISFGEISGEIFNLFLKKYDEAKIFKEVGSIRFLISKYIDGCTLNKWIEQLSENISKNQIPISDARKLLLSAIVEIIELLSFVHNECQYLHGDINSNNIIIHASSNRPIIIDFGNARCFDSKHFNDSDKTKFGFITQNYPAQLNEEIKKELQKNNSNETNKGKIKTLMFPGLDLYQFGLVVAGIIENKKAINILSSFDKEFLHFIVLRLCTWALVKNAKTADYLDQFKKLSEGYWQIEQNHFTQKSTQENKRIALSNSNMTTSELVDKIIQTRAFRRLERLNQLSLLYLVYPGATQTRFEHSLAVYTTACELINHLLKSPRFCLLFDPKTVEQLLILALLHDINHFPFLHYFQELNIKPIDKFDIFDCFCDGKATQDNPSIYSILEGVDISPKYLKDIFYEDLHDLKDPKLQVIKTIIDSGADIDKITYVMDDARTTGVPFGRGVDKYTMLAEADIAMIKEEQNSRIYRFCFKPGALSAVESLLLARYWNFKQIYWHHTNRGIEAMILHVLKKIFIDKSGSFEEYIKGTIGLSEPEAIKILNDMYKRFYTKDSIISELFYSKRVIYKRLLSIKRSFKKFDNEEEVYFDKIVSLDERQKMLLMNDFIKRLNELFKDELQGDILTDDEVLIDIPGRKLDKDMGSVHIYKISKDGTPEFTIDSPFIEYVSNEFLNLSRTIRFFISPNYRIKIGKEKIEQKREDITRILAESLKSINKTSMIK